MDASLLSTPSERELYLRSLQEERNLAQRERRRMSTEAARRPSMTNILESESSHGVLLSLDHLAKDSAYAFNYLDEEEHEEGGIIGDGYGSGRARAGLRGGGLIDHDGLSTTTSASGGETSTLSAAERIESESLDELEQLEALRLLQLQSSYPQYQPSSQQQQQYSSTGSKGRRPSSGGSSNGDGSKSPRSARPISAPHHRLALSPGILPSPGRRGGVEGNAASFKGGGGSRLGSADKAAIVMDHGVASSADYHQNHQHDGREQLMLPPSVRTPMDDDEASPDEDREGSPHQRHGRRGSSPHSAGGESPPWLRTTSPSPNSSSRSGSVLRLEDITILKSR